MSASSRMAPSSRATAVDIMAARALLNRSCMWLQGGRRHLIASLSEFRKARHERTAVKVIPDAELERLPLAPQPTLAPGGQIVLDLDTFLGAGHYMTTHGVLRKTDQGGHVDA